MRKQISYCRWLKIWCNVHTVTHIGFRLAKNTEERIQIVHEIINKAYETGLTKEDIIVDGLVTTVGANPKAAVETIDTIRYCKEKLGVGTIIGLSNISFGLPGRQYINSTFLGFAIQAGLTMAIANPSQELLMNTALASDLLLGKEGAAERYIENVVEIKTQVNNQDKSKQNYNKNNKKRIKENNSEQDAEKVLNELDRNRQAIFQAVLKGNKRDIIKLVDEGLSANNSPSDIIDTVLIPAINEVGRLFDSQRYFLPQLISGAETMKLAIDYLEPMLADGEGDEKNKGTVIAATVSGIFMISERIWLS